VNAKTLGAVRLERNEGAFEVSFEISNGLRGPRSPSNLRHSDITEIMRNRIARSLARGRMHRFPFLFRHRLF